jgi:glucose-1-phosphate adenylyltransferase
VPAPYKVFTFIMAGGKGERLYPLTRDRAKPAVPFGGIYRIIDFTLSNCLNSGLRKIYILTQYKSISLSRHIRQGWNIFDSELGEFIEIIPAQQRIDEHWYQGTADAVYQNLYSIEMEKPQPDYILILAGDHIYKMNYQKMIQYHIEKGADVTIGVVEMPIVVAAKQLGVLEVSDDDRVIGFEEKPTLPKPVPCKPDKALISMGIYVFSRDILKEELIKDTRSSSRHDFGKDVIPAILGKRKVYSYRFIDENKKDTIYWRDIGTIDAYYEASMDLVRVDPVFNLYDSEWPIRTYQGHWPPTKTVFSGGDDHKRIGLMLDSLICDGCIVSGGRAERSILSPGVRVNSYSNIQDSVIMEGCSIGRHSIIKKAILDKNVFVEENATVGVDIEKDKKCFTVTPSGIVVVAKGTVVRRG